MPLLRLIPLRLLLVLMAGLALAFCGQGLGLWTGARGAASPGEGQAANGRDAARTQQTQQATIAKRADATTEQAAAASDASANASAEAKRAEHEKQEAQAKRIAEDAASSQIADSDREGALLARDRDVALRIDEIVAAIQQGSFHAACRQLQELDLASQPRAKDALRERSTKLGWPELTGEVRDPSPWIRAEFSLQGRLVRASMDAPAARVLSQDADSVTLRVPSPLGVTFPKVATHSVEPDAVRADEATELGYLAYGSANHAAARVWCAIAIARSGEPSARALQLKQLLR